MTGVASRGYTSCVGTGMPTLWAATGVAAGPIRVLMHRTATDAAPTRRDVVRDITPHYALCMQRKMNYFTSHVHCRGAAGSDSPHARLPTTGHVRRGAYPGDPHHP